MLNSRVWYQWYFRKVDDDVSGPLVVGRSLIRPDRQCRISPWWQRISPMADRLISFHRNKRTKKGCSLVAGDRLDINGTAEASWARVQPTSIIIPRWNVSIRLNSHVSFVFSILRRHDNREWLRVGSNFRNRNTHKEEQMKRNWKFLTSQRIRYR